MAAESAWDPCGPTYALFRARQAQPPHRAQRRCLLRRAQPGIRPPGRPLPSKREVLAQHHELRRLREDFARLQVQCSALQAQVDRLSMERRWHGGGGGFFKWSTFWFGGMSSDVARVEDSESGIERRTPASGKKGRGGALD
uniref:Uncharacterized protein n=1 Tax=Oryza glaberrima TaxID=4538 RepID=I1NV53_ORYGL